MVEDKKGSSDIVGSEILIYQTEDGHTAAEVIYERADASHPFMGLKSFSGDFPVLKDISIAKNYLHDEELKILNNIVSGYFDFAEIQAMRHNPMYMADYVEHLDNVLKTTGEKVLQGCGTISHAQPMNGMLKELYEKLELHPYWNVRNYEIKSVNTALRNFLQKNINVQNENFQNLQDYIQYLQTDVGGRRLRNTDFDILRNIMRTDYPTEQIYF